MLGHTKVPTQAEMPQQQPVQQQPQHAAQPQSQPQQQAVQPQPQSQQYAFSMAGKSFQKLKATSTMFLMKFHSFTQINPSICAEGSYYVTGSKRVTGDGATLSGVQQTLSM